jgi:hypothetical protein
MFSLLSVRMELVFFSLFHFQFILIFWFVCTKVSNEIVIQFYEIPIHTTIVVMIQPAFYFTLRESDEESILAKRSAILETQYLLLLQ